MNRRVLVVAAHPDDEVLGCGATIAKWKTQGAAVHVLLLADGEGARADNNQRKLHNRHEAAVNANKIIGTDSLELLNLPDNRLDSLDLLEVVKLIEDRVKEIQPDTVLTHHSGDVNVDHRIAHDAVLAACRPQPGCSVKQLLFFEVLSSTEWRPFGSGEPFMPNFFVDVADVIEQKIAALMAYESELRDFPHPRSVDGVQILARWRGAMVGAMAAEAFVLGRMIA